MAEAAKGSIGKAAGTCSASADCKAGEQCEAGMCKPMATDPAMGADACPAKPCDTGSSCQNGSCVGEADGDPACDPSKPCPSGSTCQSGACKPTTADAGTPSRRSDAGTATAPPRDPAGDPRADDDGDDDSAAEDDEGDDSAAEDDEEEYDRDESAARAAGSDGCNAGGRADGLAALLALTLLAGYRRARSLRVARSRSA